MFDSALQVLFLGETSVWWKVAQAIVEAPNTSLEVHRAATVRDAMRSLVSRKWDAVLVDFSDSQNENFLSVPRMFPDGHAIPMLAIVPKLGGEAERRATLIGATACLGVDQISTERLQQAVRAAIERKAILGGAGKIERTDSVRAENGGPMYPVTKIEAVSHALNNLLCIISANADILAEQPQASQNAERSILQIKEATKNAATLMRSLR